MTLTEIEACFPLLPEWTNLAGEKRERAPEGSWKVLNSLKPRRDLLTPRVQPLQ
jgi:hypothetical protein